MNVIVCVWKCFLLEHYHQIKMIRVPEALLRLTSLSSDSHFLSFLVYLPKESELENRSGTSVALCINPQRAHILEFYTVRGLPLVSSLLLDIFLYEDPFTCPQSSFL